MRRLVTVSGFTRRTRIADTGALPSSWPMLDSTAAGEEVER
jgi:hypothetical protein